MEEVLDLYENPYDSRYPLLCMDETSKQLVSDVQPPLPPQPGQIVRQDYEYERNGVCNLFEVISKLKSVPKIAGPGSACCNRLASTRGRISDFLQ